MSVFYSREKNTANSNREYLWQYDNNVISIFIMLSSFKYARICKNYFIINDPVF